MNWLAVSYSKLNGWELDDHLAAFSCFRMSAKGFSDNANASRSAVAPSNALLAVAEKALFINTHMFNCNNARDFFEENFTPHAPVETFGFVTAYFEPEVEASRTKTDKYSYPVYGRPDDLVRLDDMNNSGANSMQFAYGRQTVEGITEYHDRAAIDSGALAGMGLEIYWLRTAIEAYFIHIQGSARLRLDDMSTVRISYAGKTGHPYTSIGKILVSRGVFSAQEANMENIRNWLEADLQRAMEVLHQNRSYIFFREVEFARPDFGPVAAAGVQLTPGRSIAVDRNAHAYGMPIWIATHKPLPHSVDRFQRLMIAQDTGSAIVGQQRGDLFIGSGAEAGMIAGSVRHDCEFVVLKPEVK